MKFLKYILLVVVFFSATGVKAQFYNVNVEPVCFTTPSGVDSTIFAAYLSSTNTTRSTFIHYFVPNGSNSQTTPVDVSGGTVRPGTCSSDSLNFNLVQNLIDNDTVIIELGKILDSLSSVIASLDSLKNPQICNCDYELDQQNIAFENITNSPDVFYNYDQVLTRNCGAGAEEIYRARTVERIKYNSGSGYSSSQGRNHIHYNNNVTADSLRQNMGMLDSMRVFLKNPTATLTIYFDTATVKTIYPSLTTLDTTDLVFDKNNLEDWENAVTAVINAALNKYSADSSLPTVNRLVWVDVTALGRFEIGFHVFHQPTGHYVNIIHDDLTRFIDFKPDGTTATSRNGVSRTGISALVTSYYYIDCGTLAPDGRNAIPTTYTGTIVPSSDLEWDRLALSGVAHSLVATKGNCSQNEPCPSAQDCFSPCEALDVRIVGDTVPVTNNHNFYTELISNSLSNPSFPSGVDEINIYNFSSTAFIRIVTNKGAQIVGPNASVFMASDNMEFSSISAVAGSFTTGDELVLNYSVKQE